MNNKRNIKFEKVSRNQFISSMQNYVNSFKGELDLNEVYNNIKLPKRKTSHSAGYDFFLPADFTIIEGETILIPTGIRCKMDDDLVLEIYPRSSYGFKYGMEIANTVGIIDSDYYYADNEGHIMIKLKFSNIEYGLKSMLRKEMNFHAGDSFVQGIFKQYFISEDDGVTEVRTGGIGSTGK